MLFQFRALEMSSMLSWILCLLYLALATRVPAAGIDVSSPSIVAAAEYAVSALSELSESEIYRTLTLSEIQSASAFDGVFHKNVQLELELASPHFKSGLDKEVFHIVVMTHKEDGSKSVAIDEFPVMNEDRINDFLVEKIKRKRKQKKDILLEMEEEAMLEGLYVILDKS